MPHLHPAHFASPDAYPSILDRYAAQVGHTRTQRPQTDASRTLSARQESIDRQQERKAKWEVRRG